MKYTFITVVLALAITACNNNVKQLSWSFAANESYTYSYASQKEIITTGENFTGTALYKTIGDMVIRANEKGTASIALQNGEKTTYTPDTDGSILDSFMAAYEWKVDLMNPNGSIMRQDNNSSIPLELLLGLPHHIPHKGQEIEQPLKLIIFDGKQAYSMTGKGIYTLVSYKKVNGYNCAEIKGNLTFDYENTNDRNKIKINTTAEVTYYFATDKHCLVQGTINFSQKVIPIPEEDKISLYWANTKEETTNVELTVNLKKEN